LLIIVGGKYEPGAYYLAYAGHCFLDSKTNRPVVGRMVYNLSSLKKDVDSFVTNVDVTLHEIFHILVMNSYHFMNFLDENG